MIVRVVAVILGVLFVAGGLVCSPFPWLAAVFVGGALGAFGLLSDSEAP